MGGGEGLERVARLVDAHHRRIGIERAFEALGVEHLRHQADIGHAGRIAVAERAGAIAVGQQPFQRDEALGDPVRVPGIARRVVMAERPPANI